MHKVQHCGNYLVFAGGGVKSYVDGLLAALPDLYEQSLVSSLDDINQSLSKLLHFHDANTLQGWQRQCPAVYTVHNHDVYCPSGTKYLLAHSQVCDRQISPVGCTWGHLVDGCGSRRPERIMGGFQRAYRNLETLQKSGVLIIANSEYVRSQLILNGIKPEQVVTLRCGILPPSRSHQPLTEEIHRQHRILFVGRIVPDKGLDWLIRTLPRLDRRICLDVAGDGWDMARVRQLAQKLNLEDRITWHGWCNGDRLEDLYHNSFAVIFPSVWPEPAGLITLEAYARYRPVIASAVGGIPEHVRDRETGILVSANSEDSLAAAIADLSQDFAKAQAIGMAGNVLFHQEFTINVHGMHLQKIYGQAIAQFGH